MYVGVGVSEWVCEYECECLRVCLCLCIIVCFWTLRRRRSYKMASVLHFSGAYSQNVGWLVVHHKPSYHTSRLGIFKKFGRMIEDSKLNSAAKPDYPKKSGSFKNDENVSKTRFFGTF